jgi:diguanylate cyclase (GGDEF)-like protein/PAS domain S-box-containing protein
LENFFQRCYEMNRTSDPRGGGEMKPGKDRKNGFVKTDRTKSVKRRVKLRQEEDFYRNLVESTSDSLYLVDRNCKYLFINKPHLLRLGLTKEESIGRSYDEFHSAAEGREFAERVKKVIAMAESVQHEYRSEKDGRYFLQTFSPVSEPGPDGRITGVAIVSKDITERKQAEEALQERELFFSGTLNDMLTFVAVLEPNGDIIFVNNTPLKIAGMNLEDVIGEKFYDTYWWKYSDEAKRTIREDIELASSGKIISHPIQVKTTEGLVWIEFSIHPIYDDKGKVKYIVPEGRDITDRKRMEEALRESEELYKILAESSFAAVFIVQDGKFVFINTSAIAYAGYSAEEMIGHSSDMIVHPDDKELVRMKSREILAGRMNQAFEFRMVTKQNEVRWISQTLTPIHYRSRLAILGNAMDVTDRRQAEELYKTLTENSLAAVFIVQDGKFVFINTSAIAYAGYNADELIGHSSDMIVHPEDREMVKRRGREMLRGGDTAPYEYRMVTKQGQIRWIMQIVSPVQFDGKPAILGNAIDVTDRRQAEELYKTLTESSLAAVFIVQDGKFVFINTSAIIYAGYAAEELIGQYSDVIVHPEDKELAKRMAKEMLDGYRNAAFEFRMVTKQNEIRWISQTVTPIQYGGRAAILGNAMDVTELKRAAENLQAASKRMQDIIEFLPDPTFVIDEKKEVIAWNRAIEEMTGVMKKDMIGKGDYAYAVPFYGYPRPILIDLVECEDEEIKTKYGFVERKGNAIFAETKIPALHGAKDVFLFGKASPFFDAMGNFYGGIETIRDITDQKRTENHLIYISTHDELTGLYNRAFFDTEVDRFALGRHFPLSFIAADVDGLKQVNDSQGHAMGDKLIQSAANVLKQSLRPDDILARIGGDEFAVLLPDTSETTAATIIARIKKNIGIFNDTCTDFTLSISLGSATAKKGDSLSKVIESADKAMYKKKFLKKAS